MPDPLRLIVAAAVAKSLSLRQRDCLAALARRPLHRVRAGWCHDLGQPAYSDSTLWALHDRRLAVHTGIDRWEITAAGEQVAKLVADG